jgi:fatty-acyl-CoA synthase
VVLKAGASLAVEDVVAFCRERLGGYKVPRQVQFTTTLPRNASGKLLKTVLREPFWKGRSRQVG